MNRIYSKVWNEALGQLVVASEWAMLRHGGAAARQTGTCTRVSRRVLALVLAAALAGTALPGMAQVSTQPVVTRGVSAVHVIPVSDLLPSAEPLQVAAPVLNRVQLVEAAPAHVEADSGSAGALTRQDNQPVSNEVESLAAPLAVQPLAATTGHFLSVNGASGEDNYNNDGAAGTNSVAIGPDAHVDGSSNQSAAMGAYAHVIGDQSTAIGNNTYAGGNSSIAIGGDDVDKASQTLYTATINGTLEPNKTGAQLFTDLTGSTAVGVGKYYATTAGDASIALGVQAQAGGVNANSNADDFTNNGVFDIAIGTQAKSQGFSSIAIGTGATASGDASFALGAAAQSQGNGATAFGSGAMAVGDSSFAMGHQADAEDQGTIAFGANAGATAENTIAFGFNATADHQNAIAFGANAQATADDSMAFGPGAVANGNKAIAIGPGSVATAAHDGTAVDFSTVGGISGNIAGAIGSAAGVVSFGQPIQYEMDANGNIVRDANGNPVIAAGGAGVQRQLQNVAPGRISDTSTDAVNGSQLNVTNQQVKSNTSAVVNMLAGGGQPVVYTDAAGNKVAQANDGNWYAAADVNPDGSLNTSNGTPTPVDAASVIASMQNVDGTATNPARLTNVADGTNPTDAVNLSQLQAQETHYYSVNDDGTQGGNYNNDGATGTNALAAGVNASATGENSIAIGSTAKTGQDRDIAIGMDATTGAISGYTGTTGQLDNLAFGANTTATGGGSIAIGQGASATGSNTTGNNNATAIGSQATVKDYNGVAIGPAASTGSGAAYSTAIGSQATVADNAYSAVAIGPGSQANASNSAAIGSNAKTMAAGTLALGPNAVATNEHDVALGSDSTTSTPSTGPYTINGGTPAGTADTTGVVSVGTSNAPRQVQNVAAGSVTAASTDAVNGSQLYAVGTSLNNLGTSTATNLGGGSAYDSTTGTVSAPSYTVNGTTYNDVGSAVAAATTHYYSVNSTDQSAGSNYGNDGATGTNSLAAGVGADAAGTNSTAVGLDSSAHGVGTVAMGKDAKAWNNATGTDIGSPNAGSVAVGDAAQAVGSNNIAVGSRAEATGSNGSSAFGVQASATGDSATSIGLLSSAAGENSVALGSATHAYDSGGIALGRTSVSGVSGNTTIADDIAIGNDAQATGGNAIAIGTGSVASGADSGAFGDPNHVSGTGSYAFGNDNTLANDDTFVLGSNVTTTQDNSVVLGNRSTDRAATTETGEQLYGSNRIFAGPASAGAGVVSVGTTGAERQIINVAAGRISADSTDAVNGSQLYQTQQAMGDFAGDVADYLGGGASHTPNGSITQPTYNVLGNDYHNVGDAIAAATTHYYSVNSTDQSVGSNYDNDGATGANALAAGTGATAAGGNAVSVGVNTQAIGANTISVGQSAVANGDQSIAMGFNATATPDNTIAIGNGAHVDGTTGGYYNAIAIGVGAEAGAGDTAKTNWNSGVAIGYNADARTMTNPGQSGGTNTSPVAIGWSANAAGNGSQVAIGDRTQATGIDAIAIGGHANSPGATATGDYSTAVGQFANASADNTLALGKQAQATQESALAIGNGAVANVTSGVAIGNNASTNGIANSVALGVSSVAGAAHTGNTAQEVTLNGVTYTFAGLASAANGTVSVGTGSHERQIQNVAAGDVSAASTDAVNGSQLYATNQAVNTIESTANSGWNLSAAGGTAAQVKPGDTVDLSSADSNLTVTKTDSGTEHDLSIALAKNLDLGATGSITAGNTVVNSTGVTINGGANPVTLTNTGLNNGGNVISNVASGGTTATNAANIGDVQAAAAAATTQVVAGTNVASVTKSTATDGHATYTVNADSASVVAGSSGDVAVTAGAKDANNNTAYTVDLSSTAQTQLANAVQYDDGTHGSVTLGNAGAPVTVTNVAAGNVAAGSTDAVNGSQLYATNQNVTTNATNISANTTNIGDLQATVAKPITFSGNDNTNGPVTAQLGDTVAITGDATTAGAYSGTNLKTVTDATTGAVSIQMADTPQFLGADMGGQKVTNVADGTVSTDAVNKGQLDAVASTAGEGWNVSAAGGAAAQVKPGDTVDLSSADSNLTVAKTDSGTEHDLSIALAKNLDLGTTGSITTGNTVVSSTGVTINGGTNPVTLTNTGLDNGGNVISNVASGGTDTTNAANIGDVQAAAAAATTQVVAGTNVASVTKTAATDGHAVYEVNAKGTTVSAGSGDVSVTAGAPDADNTTDYAVDLSAATKTKLANAVQYDNSTHTSVTLAGPTSADGGVTGGTTITNVHQGTLSSTSTDAVNGSQLYTTNQNVATNTTNIATNTSNISTNTTDIGSLQNTVSKPITFSGNDNANGPVKAKLGDQVAISGGASTSGSYSDANVKTVTNANSGSVDVQLADNPAFTSVTTGDTTVSSNGVAIANGPSITKTGVDVGGNKITNVADGTAPTDAVNKSQLDAVSGTANAGWNLTAQGANSSNVGPNDTVDLSNTDGNIKVAKSANNNNVTFNLADDLSVTSVKTGDTTVDTNGVTIANGPSITKTGVDAGGEKITKVADGRVASGSTDAVNGGQLYTTNQNVATNTTNIVTNTGNISTNTTDIGNLQNTVSKPITFSGNANANGPVKAKLGDTVAIRGGAATAGSYSDANVKTVTDSATGSVDVQLADNPEFTSVKAGNSTLDNGGLTVDDGNGNVTTTGATGTQVTDANGDTTTVASTGTTITDGAGQTVTTTSTGTTMTDGTNTTTYGSDGLAITNGPTISSAGIDAGNKKITNVTDGTDPTDAVNKSQLDAVSSTANAGWNLTAQGANSSNVGPNDTVDLSNTDGNIKVAKSANNNNVTFDLADDLSVTSVKTGDTTVDTNGVTITNGPSITKTGVNAGGQKITKVADGRVANGSTDAVNGGQLYTTNQNVATNTANIATNTTDIGTLQTTVAKPITFSGNDDANGPVAAKLGDTVTIRGGAATAGSYSDANVKTVTDSATGSVDVQLADNPEFTSVKAGNSTLDNGGLSVNDGTHSTAYGADGMTITNGPTISSSGIDASGKKVAHVADGNVSGTSTDAVNGSQLYAVQQTASAGWNVGVNGGTTTQVKPGDNVDFSNTDGNLEIAKTDHGADHDITVNLADDIDVTSVTAGNSKLDTSGLTVDDGSGNVTTTGATGTTVTDASGNTTTVASTGTTVTDGTNTTTYGADGLAIAGGPTISSAGIDAAGTKITHVAAGDVSATSTDAINGSQLNATNTVVKNLGNSAVTVLGGNASYDSSTGTLTMSNIGGTGKDNINDAIASANSAATAGWNLTAQGANSSNVGPNDAVDLNNSDGNIVVSKTATSNDVTFNLAKDIAVDSVSLGNDVKLDTTGLLIVGGPSITVAGIDAGNLKITHVAPGTSPTDAVNKSQLDHVSSQVQQLADNAVQYDDGGKGSVTLGGPTSTDGGKTGGTKITNVHRGDVSANSTDAVNGSQLYETNQHVADNSTAIQNIQKGQGGYFQVEDSSGKGHPSASGKDSTAGGAGAVASGDQSVAVGSGAKATGKGSVALGEGSVASRDDAVSVGSAGHERQVTHVAPGTEPTDAANVGQLNGAVREAKSWAKNYTDQRLELVNRDVNALGHRVDAGVASAMAMASMPQAYAPNQSAAAVGLGQFHGEVGVAVGLSTITDSGRYVFKFNASGNTRGDVGVGVGAAVVW